ncbi:hypothetical protein ACFYZN_23355 [Streptomyces sp. NPDC001777]|uniref:hypothetical protein n=1 Tax=Streptomyces sp. NPDC001777 TaxID=3364608 RepID=UPI0036AE7BA1
MADLLAPASGGGRRDPDALMGFRGEVAGGRTGRPGIGPGARTPLTGGGRGTADGPDGRGGRTTVPRGWRRGGTATS